MSKYKDFVLKVKETGDETLTFTQFKEQQRNMRAGKQTLTNTNSKSTNTEPIPKSTNSHPNPKPSNPNPRPTKPNKKKYSK